MSTDAIEMTIKNYATACMACVGAADDGAIQHPTTQLIRDGLMHALTPDKSVTLCGEKNNANEDTK